MDPSRRWSIYTALLTCPRRPDAWARLHTGENILFSAGDFSPPFRTPAWDTVASVGDAEVGDLAERLKDAGDQEASDKALLEGTPIGPMPTRPARAPYRDQAELRLTEWTPNQPDPARTGPAPYAGMAGNDPSRGGSSPWSSPGKPTTTPPSVPPPATPPPVVPKRLERYRIVAPCAVRGRGQCIRPGRRGGVGQPGRARFGHPGRAGRDRNRVRARCARPRRTGEQAGPARRNGGGHLHGRRGDRPRSVGRASGVAAVVATEVVVVQGTCGSGAGAEHARGCSSRSCRSSAARRRPRGPPPWAAPGCCGTG